MSVERTVIALNRFKVAAAYFDRFLPFPGNDFALGEIVELQWSLAGQREPVDPVDFWQGIGIPPELGPYFHVVVHLAQIELLSMGSGKDPNMCAVDHYEALNPEAKATFRHLLGDPKHMEEHDWGEIKQAACEFHSRPLLGVVNFFGWGSGVSEGSDEKEDPLIQIASIPVLDPECLDWELIRSFRKDKGQQVKLRRLRALAFENYSGKPLSFIEDDLLTRIDDHQTAAKEWGLATIQSTFSVSATKGVMTAAAAGLVAALSGQPVPIAAAIGATAILGPSTISILTSRRRFQLQQAKDPVSYMVDLMRPD